MALFLLAAFISATWVFRERFATVDDSLDQRWLIEWTVKGALGPVLLWVFVNSGLFAAFPPLMPNVALAGGLGSRFNALCDATTPAVLVIGTCWTAATLAWVLTLTAIRAKPRGEFISYVIAWSLFLLPVSALILLGGGWWCIGLAVTIWLLPIARSTLPLAIHVPPAPMYARAIAKAKFGKYDEAEWEVIRELEHAEHDFDGWMMLADLYANHFNDLATAERTIHDICDQPDATPSNIAVALQRLADWHLKIGHDPVAARQALEEILRRLPGSHLARMARLRINQLPATREELLEQRQGKPIPLPPLCDDLDATPEGTEAALSDDEAQGQSQKWVAKLKADPNDVPARESFARLLAERLRQPDLAIEQMKLLLEMPGPLPTKRAEWLGIIAAWHLKHRQDPQTARTVLEQLLHEFPHSPQAFAAQRRLKLMEMNERLRISKATRAIPPASL